MSEEISDGEIQTDSTGEDSAESNTVEYEQELYGIVNFSNYVEEENSDIRTNFELFYPTSKRNKVSRLQQLSARQSPLVVKVTNFSKESVQNFIPLCENTSNNQQKQNLGKWSQSGFRNNFVKNMVKSRNLKRRLGMMPREYNLDKTPSGGKKTRPAETPDVIELSDSDDCGPVTNCDGCVDDDVLEVLRSDDSHRGSASVIEPTNLPGTSGIFAQTNETSVADDSVILCNDVDKSKVTVASECGESDIEILPMPQRPSPLLINLDSGDEIPSEESSKLMLANVDANSAVMEDQPQYLPPVPDVHSSISSSASLSSAVARCWTLAMIKFYNEPSRDEDFDHRTLQIRMSRSPRKWRIDPLDVVPPLMSRRLRQLRCSNCNQRGHLVVKCPDPIRIRVCSLCGQTGHTYTRCPNSVCPRCGAFCFSCSKSGCSACMARDCYCNHCGSREHVNRLCPEVWRCYHHTTHAVLNNISDHPAENLKPDNEQCCPNCGLWGHKYEECGIDAHWLGKPDQPHPTRAPSTDVNGWSRHNSQNWFNAPRNSNWFHSFPRTVENQQQVATNRLQKMNYAANAKSAKALKLNKLLRKRKRKEKLARRKLALANGVLAAA